MNSPERRGFTPMAPHLFTAESMQAPFAQAPMDPRANAQVQACVRAEWIIKRVWRNLAAADVVLVDPAHARALAPRVDAAAADFHRRASKGQLRYDTHDGDADFDPDATHEQGSVRLWHVGSSDVFVVRDRWHDSPNRRGSTTDYAAGMFANNLDTAIYCDAPCTVNIAENCGGETRLLPVDRGTLIMLFRCCWACEAEAIAALEHPAGT